VIGGEVIPEGGQVENPTARMKDLGLVVKVTGAEKKAEPVLEVKVEEPVQEIKEELLFEESADVAVETEEVEEAPVEEPVPAQPSQSKKNRNRKR